jgi:TfoX/Sxy family transcriptional regulator of competence genes
MARDETMIARIGDELASRRNVSEKRMFGGVCFFLNGNMLAAAGRVKGRMLVRVGADQLDAALERGAKPMEMGGRTMKGYVFAYPRDGRALKAWVAMAEKFVRTLPPKTPKKIKMRTV